MRNSKVEVMINSNKIETQAFTSNIFFKLLCLSWLPCKMSIPYLIL